MAIKVCTVQCLKEAVNACREVHAVLKKRLVGSTSRRLTTKKHRQDDDRGAS